MVPSIPRGGPLAGLMDMSSFSPGRLLKDVAVYATGDLILRAGAVISMPLYTRLLSPEEYGLWGGAVTVASLLQGILILGCDSAYARWFFQAKTESDRRVLTSTLLLFLAGWSACAVALLVPFRGLLSQWMFDSPAFGNLIAMGLSTIPVTLLNFIAAQALRNQFRGLLLVLQNAVYTGMSIGLSLSLILGMKMGVLGIFAGSLLAGLIFLPVRLLSIRPLLGFCLDARLLKSLLSYGLPFVPATLAYWIFSGSDRILLARLSSLDQVGYYSAASVGMGVLVMLNSALGQAWSPHAIQLYEHHREQSPVIYGRTLTYILALFGSLSVGAATFAPEALRLVATARFVPAAAAVGPLALGIMASASSQVTALGISLSHKTGHLGLHSWVAAVLNVGLNILSIPRWGLAAAAWSTAASYGYLTLAYGITSQRLVPMKYEFGRIATIGLLAIGFTAGAGWLPSGKLLESLAIKVGYVMLFIALMGAFRVIRRQDWAVFAPSDGEPGADQTGGRTIL